MKSPPKKKEGKMTNPLKLAIKEARINGEQKQKIEALKNDLLYSNEHVEMLKTEIRKLNENFISIKAANEETVKSLKEKNTRLHCEKELEESNFYSRYIYMQTEYSKKVKSLERKVKSLEKKLDQAK